jgi:hypothetical protein
MLDFINDYPNHEDENELCPICGLADEADLSISDGFSDPDDLYSEDRDNNMPWAAPFGFI